MNIEGDIMLAIRERATGSTKPGITRYNIVIFSNFIIYKQNAYKSELFNSDETLLQDHQ